MSVTIRPYPVRNSRAVRTSSVGNVSYSKNEFSKTWKKAGRREGRRAGGLRSEGKKGRRG
jgi:hypothetical protein